MGRNSCLLRSKSNYCRPEVSAYTKTYQNSFNRSRVNDVSEHFQSKSYAQIKLPEEMSDEGSFLDEEKEQSQTNV